MKAIYVLIVLILSTIISFSKQISIDIDGAMFKIDDKSNRWEMYYSFPDTVLSYKYKKGKYYGAMYMSVKLKADSTEASNGFSMKILPSGAKRLSQNVATSE